MGVINTLDGQGANPTRLLIDEVGSGFAPTEALHIRGNIRMEDGSEAAGLALVDDGTGTGVATWGVSAAAGPFDVRTVAVDTVATVDDKVLRCTAGGITVTLYTAVGNTGRDLYIDNDSAGNVTVDGDGVETIENELTQTLTPDSAMHIYSTGAKWRII